MIQLENRPLMAFVCVRRTYSVVTERIFLAACGEKLVARIAPDGVLIEITGFHKVCISCRKKENFIRELINSGK